MSGRAEMLSASLGLAEGSPRGVAEIVHRTRLAHEISPAGFPAEVELHWFENGLHVVGPGDRPAIYQTPMSRVGDLVRPREWPMLPEIRDFQPK